ncbi:hypothetical protein ACFOW1_01555 [Parasediminibacterium paludis]|uniref:Uncharacterized protein n=1 Tax=Parasediminibacterium paludis TaxID=908966 RepID=A0ABV8PUI4_9BACT
MYYAIIVAAIFLFVMLIAWFATGTSEPYKYGGNKDPKQQLDDWQNDFFPKHNKN